MFALTLPEKVAAFLSELYAKKSVILEYGTGGSTFLALEANDHRYHYCIYKLHNMGVLMDIH